VVVIGAGFSGLGIGIRLKEAGIPFVIVDRAPEVGGTWYHNTYPGCACDIESQLYSFSFEPNPNWSRVYPPQGEILEYLKHVAQKFVLFFSLRELSTLFCLVLPLSFERERERRGRRGKREKRERKDDAVRISEYESESKSESEMRVYWVCKGAQVHMCANV
jgi:cation diffusion facilitator CzcD-associated flavoprotein CzcO